MIGRTKIVATIGPASSSPEVLRRLIDAGVSVFRLNFSHGTHDEHSAVVSHIRSVSRDMERHVGILQDLCGPKMRLGSLPGDLVECRLAFVERVEVGQIALHSLVRLPLQQMPLE